MATISLCMIVRNEEDVLARCLESVQGIADEIIIVDTGSQDTTKAVARQYTSQVYDFVWQDDFAAARNVAFSHGKMDFLLWLDADDVIRPEDKSSWLKLKETLSLSTDIVMAPYHIAFDAEGNPTFTYQRERLIRNGRGFLWAGRIHEVITPAGVIAKTEAAVCHRKLKAGDPDRNLRIFERALAEGETLNARQQYYYARELYYHGQYGKAVVQLERFLTDNQGWVENKIGACQIASYCYSQLQEDDKALQMLFQSFLYDLPRAEICCDIGSWFMARALYKQAIFWFEQATHCEMDTMSGGFVQPDCYGYIPFLQLCVCYDRLGQYEQAAAYNEQAAAYKPEEAAVVHNRAYFRTKGL